MLIHSADFLSEQGHPQIAARYFGQEMNWGNFAIGKINSVLHGLEADIRDLPLKVKAEMALKEAVAEHKRRGIPIAVWRNGKAVWIPPEEIVVPEG
jgi:hypothetical protein